MEATVFSIICLYGIALFSFIEPVNLDDFKKITGVSFDETKGGEQDGKLK